MPSTPQCAPLSLVPNTGEHASFDEGVLRRLRAEIGSEATGELILFFADETRSRLARLTTAVADADRSTILCEADALETSSATFGLIALQDCARQMVLALDGDRLPRVAELLKTANAIVDQAMPRERPKPS